MNAAPALLTPLDAIRSRFYRLLAPWLSGLYGDRTKRVAVLGVVAVTASFFITAAVPLWSLALGPLVFGVPHLLSDLRYLVVRQGLHRHLALVLLGGAPLVATSFGFGPEVGLLATFVAVLAAQGSWWRKGPLLAAWGGLFGAALAFPVGFQLVFLHVHNLVALGVWWLWRKRSWWSALVPATVALGAAALLTGAADPLLTALGGWSAPWTGTSLEEFVETTTPLADPTLAVRLVLLFCFLQQLHYGAWLRMIPDEDRARPAPRTFRATWQALEADFGPWPLRLTLALSTFFAVWGAFSLYDARMGYLHLAAFHGYLELAAGAWLLVEGRRA